MAKKDTQFTNRPDIFLDEETGGPENWTEVPTEGPLPEKMPTFPSGATGPTSVPGVPGDADYSPAAPPDPRLGMNPQGEWTQERVRTMLPGVLPDATANLLDPAEQAKKEAGLPYDKNKMFQSDPNWQPNRDLLPAGYGRPQRPIRRQDIEREIFGMYGNPFTMDPYGEVVKADAQLPQLFDYIFDGKVTWSDIGRLNKQQREVWEDAKKEFHARTYKEAKAKQERALNAYKWMMGNYEADMKIEEQKAEKLEKAEAARLAREGKAPTTKDLWDPEAQAMTLHQYDSQTGRWVSTGQKVGVPGLEDKMPPDVRADWEFIKAQGKKVDPTMMLVAMMSKDKDPEGAKKIMDQMAGSSEDRDRLIKANNNYNKWRDSVEAKRIEREAGKAQPTIEDKQYPDRFAVKLLRLFANKNPQAPQLLEGFEKTYGSSRPELVAKVKRMVRKGGNLTQADINSLNSDYSVGPGAKTSPMTLTGDDLELEAAKQQGKAISGAVSDVAKQFESVRGPVPLI